MATFQEVIGHWKRMCDTYTTDDAKTCCKGCPMESTGCGAIYEDDNADPEVIELKVMAWAAEHPEPVYPAWRDWLRSQYPMMGPYTMTDILEAHIPADIAKKLGIKPKEDT